jgi:hypothetical protein
LVESEGFLVTAGNKITAYGASGRAGFELEIKAQPLIKLPTAVNTENRAAASATTTKSTGVTETSTNTTLPIKKKGTQCALGLEHSNCKCRVPTLLQWNSN